MCKQLIYILLLLPVAVMAAGNDSINREFRIEEVEVVARRIEEPVIPAQRLEGARLDELSVQSVADAMRYFSGVQIKDYGGVGGLKTVDIRSMGTHHLGVFYDGIEIGNAQNGTVDLGKFSMENIEALSLYNGQKAEILQSAKDYGSAGTLYIRTRRPHFSKGKNYNVSMTMKAGSFGLANPSLLYEQKLTENIHLSMNAEYTYATGRYKFRIHKLKPDGSLAWDTTGVRQNGDIQSGRAEVGLFGYLPHGKWHIKGYYYQSEKGIPRAIVRHVWTSDQRQWDRNAFVQGSYQQSWMIGERGSQDISLLINAKYSNDYMRYLNPDTTQMYVDNQFWQQEVYLSAALKYSPFSWWDMSVSGDYQWNSLSATLANFVYPTRHTGLVAAATAFHYRWIRVQASVLGSFVRDQLGMENGKWEMENGKFRSQWTPAVFLSYQPLLREQWYIRGFYKDIYRMPTFNDLYYTDIGNISLRPEKARQFDLGIEYDKQLKVERLRLRGVSLHAKTDGYFNQIKDKIVAIPKGNSQYRWMMMNLGYVEILGMDVNVGAKLHFEHDVVLDLSGTYTYQLAQDKTDPTDEVSYGGQIAYIPKHSCSALANLCWNGLSFNYSFIYVGERYHNSANIPTNYEQPWYTHDVSVGYDLRVESRKSKVESGKFRGVYFGVEINNLFNQQYDVILNYPMPGFNGKGIVRVKL